MMRLNHTQRAVCNRAPSHAMVPGVRVRPEVHVTLKVSCKSVIYGEAAGFSNGRAISPSDNERMENYVRMFNMADIDGNGEIDKEELRNLLESMESGMAYLLEGNWLPQEELDRIVLKYDANQNGTICLEEFKMLAFDNLLLEGMMSDYEDAFKAVDRSGNGTIGAMELATLFASLGNRMSPEKMVEVMQQYDRDESGQIEFPEFLLMCRDSLVEVNDVLAYMRTLPEKDGTAQTLIQPLKDDLTLIFSETELDEIIAERHDRITVIFAGLTWCRPCKGMQRPMQKLAEHYKDVTFLKLFGNANARTKYLFKTRLQIRSTPCFIVFRGDKVLYSQTGSNKEKFETNLRSFLRSEELPEAIIYPNTH